VDHTAGPFLGHGCAMTTSHGRALALGQLAMLFVGSAVAAASLLADYPVLTGQAVRYAAAAAGLWAWTRLRSRRLPRLTRRDASWVFGVALVGMSGFNVVLIEATGRIDPSVVGAVLGGTPIALAVLGPLQAGRPIARRTLACALVVAAGVLLVERASGPLDPIGLALTLLVLAGEVGFSLLAVRPLRRIGAVGVSFHAVWIAAVQLAIGALLLERHALRWPTAVEAGALAHMAVFVTVVAFVAWYTALDRLGADRAGLLVGTVAVTALGTAALVGTTTVTPTTVLGCALVIAGVAVGVRTPEGKRQATPEPRAAHRQRLPTTAPQPFSKTLIEPEPCGCESA